MNRALYGVAVAGVALAAIATARALTHAKFNVTSNGEVAEADSTDARPVAPVAVAALDRMGSYLRTLKAFQVKADITREVVLESGLKVQLSSSVDLVARKPDRLRLQSTSDRHDRLFVYDGKTFAMYARRMGYYATVPAPSTIIQLADTLSKRYDIDLPLVDLFRWSNEKADVAGFGNATDVGPSVIGGVTCEQYAFRQDGVDWQVWIQQGDYPLPRKVVLTTTTDEARPQYEAVYTWNLAPSYDDATFVFTPPTNANRILLADAMASAKQGKP